MGKKSLFNLEHFINTLNDVLSSHINYAIEVHSLFIHPHGQRL